MQALETSPPAARLGLSQAHPVSHVVGHSLWLLSQCNSRR